MNATIFENDSYSIQETPEGTLISVKSGKVRPINRKTFRGFESDATRSILAGRGIPSLVVSRIINQAYGQY
jgi:hypothetical protein